MRHRYSERECSRTGQQEAAAICTVFITWVLYDWGRLKKKKDGQALAGQHHALATPETDVSVVTVCAGGLASDSRTGARAAFERSGWGEELIDVATGNGAGWKRGARRVEAAPRCVREGWGADGAMLRCSGAGWGAGRRRFRAGRRARGAGCGCGALVGRVGCRDIPREGGDQRKVEFCKAKKKKNSASHALRLHCCDCISHTERRAAGEAPPFVSEKGRRPTSSFHASRSLRHHTSVHSLLKRAFAWRRLRSRASHACAWASAAYLPGAVPLHI